MSASAVYVLDLKGKVLKGAHLQELPWGCGHVRGGALHAHSDGEGGGGHAVTYLGPWWRSFHVD
uniref:Adaptor-related protein complex AP-1, mu subunit 1 n=1 Tax=Mus musculus TaxID=10090 RepID=A0A1D5RMJ1_MOUSE